MGFQSVDLADTIFQADWTELNEDAKTILLIVMIRTKSAIELVSAHVMTVNIDFFVTVSNVHLHFSEMAA